MKNGKQRVLAKLEQTYCRIMPSSIDGVGVIAVRDIPAGTDPFFGVRETTSYRFHPSELVHLDPEILKMISDYFVVDEMGTYVIPEDGLNDLEIGFLLNQSENANLYTPDGGETFFTTRLIKKGEELTVSYDTFDYRNKIKNGKKD